ncbi:hypothetical protein ATANTOWER_024048 [Ataeniobius toweri]|uniref:Uncharacterized protein n=1 Tax=Ataeniobius toweri TaxID=208326 RepID=A0ABU7BKG9_9TELE|nr:hypothetical protein [Ataeniobius toweri]
MHHLAHHHAQGKDGSPASRRAPMKGQSPLCKEAAPHNPETQHHQHPCQPSRNEARPSRSSSRDNTTDKAVPHFLPYVHRDMVKTTNQKHTMPTRNHPAEEQTPSQYKAKKPDASAKPSDTHPTATTHEPYHTGPPPHHQSTPYSGVQNAAKSTQRNSKRKMACKWENGTCSLLLSKGEY